MKELIIGERDCGQRLDKYLAKYLSQAPKSFLYKMMRKKNITLNRSRCDGSERLAPGDRIYLFFSDETLEKFSAGQKLRTAAAEAPVRDELQVVYEDSHILLINKRAGELSQKAKETDVSLVEQILVHAQRKGLVTPESLKTCRPSVCNRLDRNTSGLVAAGLSLPGLAFLSEQLKSREIKKYYLCLVSGRITVASHLKGYLAKDEGSNRVTIAEQREQLPKRLREEAQWIETGYEPISASDHATLLRVHLITGRSHQIRAHLASIGHPIIGDPKYGDPCVNRRWRKDCGVRSQLLHAWEMQFGQVSGQFSYLSDRSFFAPLPREFVRALEWAGLNDGMEEKEG